MVDFYDDEELDDYEDDYDFTREDYNEYDCEDDDDLYDDEDEGF